MHRLRKAHLDRRWFALVLVAAWAWQLAAPGGAHARFELGVEDPEFAARAGPTLNTARDARARVVRRAISWAAIAPIGDVKPAGFDATDPADPHYRAERWAVIDDAVRTATDAGLQVLLVINQAPAWAEGPNRPSDPDVRPGAWKPDPGEVASFARAAARRYSGSFPDPQRPGRALPRVDHWQAWNEQNLPWYFAPQSIDDFRILLNSFYDAVKSVHQDNVVVTGGLAPVSFLRESTSPLVFAERLLCVRRSGSRYVRGPCATRAKFDVFAHHPYSLAATPTKPAFRRGDVLVADMSKLERLLDAAARLRTVEPTGRSKRLWVTEFSWFSNPPNSGVGDPPKTAQRYAALSLYLLWRSGVDLVNWYNLVDAPAPLPSGTGFTNGGGLYYADGRPKPMLQAFRFPLYAEVKGGRGYAWGRAPTGGRAVVRLYRRAGRGWRYVARTRTGPDGVFVARFRESSNRTFQARLTGAADRSITYHSKRVPPRRIHGLR